MSHEGQLLRKYLKDNEISVVDAVNKLGLKSRSSLYKYFENAKFKPTTFTTLEEKLGFRIEETLHFPEDQNRYEALLLRRAKLEDQLEIIDLELLRIEKREDGSEKSYLKQIYVSQDNQTRYPRLRSFD